MNVVREEFDNHMNVFDDFDNILEFVEHKVDEFLDIEN
jgi:hypothetical protein